MKKIIIIGLLIASSAFTTQAQIWTKADTSQARSNPKQRIIKPKRFSFFKLNLEALQAVLRTTVQESKVSGRDFPTVLELPMPDGSLQKFKIVESSIMEDELQKKYPEIRSYFGIGLNDKYATVRFDVNPYFGFSAQILSIKGNVYIDPFINGNTEYYQSYFTKEYAEDVKKNPKSNCHTSSLKRGIEPPNIFATAPCRGDQRWSYILAIGCTHQYAIAATGKPNPTKAEALGKINTTFNRVTGIYASELSITFTLANNMDKIIFVTAASDKYTGNSNDQILINESQTIISDSIGAPNFNIGHTFSTGAGGLASLGVVCKDAQKAKGVTGASNPTGDAYDVDFVAHEIGHQFGAEHTFNNNSNGSCAGNREDASAFEPGSGSTIMAYAGICDPDNIQENSDPHFHTHSYDQIINYINANGGCKTFINLPNEAPQIKRMNFNNKTIPKGTPFILSGNGSDIDPITYSWEEMDLGTAGDWNSGANDPNRPLFRSRIPTADTFRIFPKLEHILAGLPANPGPGDRRGETLPQVAREMKFRLTVRDNFGGVATGGDGCSLAGIFKINVANTGPFKIKQPNVANIKWKQKSCQKIKWDPAGSFNAPVSCSHVNILLSTDGGLTYPVKLKENTPNDGGESIDVPEVTSNTCRIKIEAVDNIFFDINDQFFEIKDVYDPELKVAVVDATGCDKKNGKATLTVERPLAGITYKYSVDDGTLVSNNVFSNLAAGEHTAFAFFADTSCALAQKFVVKGPETNLVIAMSGAGTVEFCQNTKPPTVIVAAAAAGGSGEYTYTPANALRTFRGATNNAPVSFSVLDRVSGCRASVTGRVSITEVVCSKDPNDIIGPVGFGDAKMVSKFVQWPYKIRYENDPEFATAPAQIVKINMPVDPDLNLFSFRLGDFGFGNFNFVVPPNKTAYSTRLDLVDSLGIVVDVTAGIDVAKREVFWILESKDPETGLPPADPFKGFLPVNDTISRKGEGYVTFTIKPANTSQTGDTVKAEATIVFDVNEAIITPEIFNTIDAVAPSSQLLALASNQDSARFAIRFAGQDDPKGSGLASFDLYVSVNGGPFSLDEEGITDTVTNFTGIPGNTYSFFTRAKDNTGNLEALKLTGDKSTTIKEDVSKPDLGPDVVTARCVGESIDLTSFFELQSLSQNWDTPTPEAQLTSGIFRIIATNTDGLSDTAFITVSDKPKPTLGVDQQITICEGSSINISNFFNASSFETAIWSTSRPDSATPGNTYQLIVTNTEGCRDSANLAILQSVALPVPVISLVSGSNPICFGDSLQLQSSVSTGNLWSNGATTTSIFVKNASIITVRTIAEACTSGTSTPIIIQVSNPGTVQMFPAGGSFANPTPVNITTNGAGSIIYTLNGTEPTPGQAGTLTFNGPILISNTSTLKAKTLLGNCIGKVVSNSFIINGTLEKVDAPVITPPTGVYTSNQLVTISSTVPGVTIYYTISGNRPRFDIPNSYTKLYTGPFLVSVTTTVNAVAVKEGFSTSNNTVSYITINNGGIVSTPVFNPGAGTFDGSVTVSISSATPGAEIWFTTNGNNPRLDVPNSFTKPYTGPLTFVGTSTIKAIATKSGLINSAMVTGNFVVNTAATVANPTFSPAPGNYLTSQNVTMSSTTPEAQIFYTSNGNTPRFDVFNTFTKSYAGPISINGAVTFKAVARKTGFLNSSISVGNYTIGPVRQSFENEEASFYFESEPTETDALESKIKVVPNPSQGRFRIMAPPSGEESKISILNILGQTIFEGKIEKDQIMLEVDISKQPTGIYLIKYQGIETTKELRITKY